MFTIHTGIPAPVKTPTGRPANKYPFASMNVGDNFFAAIGESTEKTVLERMRVNVTRWKKDTGNTKYKFQVSAHPNEAGEPAVGVWRMV